ncbi:MAG TPA: LamG-like jellyroll fold domain-containing protein [Ignavibacteria bacterium]|nr:LamG-like jellyroll fold domain-containing protein [Ignavibacteria bacterium]
MKRISFLLFFLTLIILFAEVSTAQTPQYYNYQNVGTSSNFFPFGVVAGKEVQWLVGPNEFAQPTPAPSGMRITKLYFFMTGASSNNLVNLTIKLGQAAINTLPTGAWYAGQLDTVYHRPAVTLTSTALGWMSITLDRPFNYDPSLGLVIDINQCGATSTTMTTRQNGITGFFRRNYSAAGSCPFTWGGQDANVANCGIDVEAAGSPQNFALRLPTPGVNTNYVAIPHQASMIGLTAYTIEAWMRPGSTVAANTVLNKGGASFDYQLGVSAGGVPFVRNQGGIATSVGLIITAGVWTHLAATFDGSTVRFYKDGVLASTVPLATLPGSSANEMRIGRGNADAGTGNLKEVRLWSTARTQAQIDSNRCRKYPSTFSSSTGLKAVWHFDSTFVDSVSGYNGTPVGTIGFDTVSYPFPGVCSPSVITPVGVNIPDRYSLSQNYPNPFNPTTRIEFAIPRGEFVELKLYDLLGKEVGVLVQGPYEAGRYIFDFNAGSLSSGIYFYTITAGSFRDTKKMLLVK